MEIDHDDLDELFEENENENAADTENKGPSEESSERVKVPVPKRIIKNPRLKFNPERLCGERGIPILVDHFKDVKFKGKGYEKENLDKLLSTLEIWTHRLFPSMKFEDCLNQIEKLGKKRPVQTCVRKIRLDMPILSRDFVNRDDDEDNVQRNDDPEPFPEDPFDKLIGESQDILNSSVSVAESFNNINFVSSSPMPDSAQGQVLGSSFGSSLTEEQKKRMEHNRLLAAERRKAKLEAMKLNTSSLQLGDDEASNSQSMCASNDRTQKHDSSDIFQSNHSEGEGSTLMMETDHHSSETQVGHVKELFDPSAEHLELDDLIDLVGKGESSKKSTVSLEEMESYSDDTKLNASSSQLGDDEKSYSQRICASNDRIQKPDLSGIIRSSEPDGEESTLMRETDHHSCVKEILDAKELSNLNAEHLGLDDLIDLVEEDESSKNSTVALEEIRSHSDDINNGK